MKDIEKQIKKQERKENLEIIGYLVVFGCCCAALGGLIGFAKGNAYNAKIVDEGFNIVFANNPGFKEQMVEAMTKTYKNYLTEGL